MERYFELHHITDPILKIKIGVLYLDAYCFRWWYWHVRALSNMSISQPHFCKSLCTHLDRESHFLGFLTKLKQTDSVKEFITNFEQLAIYTKNLVYSFYVECFISGLKEAIQSYVHMQHLATQLQDCECDLQVETIINVQHHVPTFPNKVRCPPSTT